MSAKPEVVGRIGDEFARVPQSVMDAVVVRMEEQELNIESLKRQLAGLLMKNAILQTETNEAQLKAAHQIALSKFSEAQMYQRVLAVEKHLDQIANYVQRFADVPTREEFEILKNDYYAHSANA